jgi:hypothetical protein
VTSISVANAARPRRSRSRYTATSIVTGPLTRHVSGIDLSFTSAVVVGGVLYYALVKAFPERGVRPVGPEDEVTIRPRLGMIGKRR